MIKIFNKIVSLLMVLPLMAILLACEKNAEYSPADILSTAQVYFPNNLDSLVRLERAADSFYVEIDRINTQGEITIPLTFKQDSVNLFSQPTSVTFKDGESKAYIAIAYQSMDMQYNDMHPITIAIDNANYTTPYGDVVYSFRAGLQIPWSEWTTVDIDGNSVLGDIGTGTYTYSLLWNDTDRGLHCYFRQNTLNKAQVQFAIPNWAYGSTLYLNGVWSDTYQRYLLSLDKTFTGYTDASYGDVYVEDLASYQGFVVGTNSWYNYPSTYNPETGLFSLCLVYFVSQGYFGYGFETFQMDGFKTYDYTVSCSYTGILKDPKDKFYALVDLNLGSDVDTVKYAVLDAEKSAYEIATKIDNGKLKFKVATESGRVQIPLTDDGRYRAVFVSYSEGEAHAYDQCAFEFENMTGHWTSLGIGAYRDDFISSVFAVESQFYEVEVQENNETPGLYRLVYPYGSVYPLNESDTYDPTIKYYMEINASNPDAVYIDKQNQGLDWGYGYMYVWSYAGYYMSEGYTLDEIKGEGICGKMKDGIITFPNGALLISFPNYSNGKFFTANVNDQFLLYLPDAYEEADLVRAQVRKHKATRRRVTVPYSLNNTILPMVTDKKIVHHVLMTDMNFHIFPTMKMK